MSAPLYTREILRLAVSIPHQQRLDKPDGTAEVRSQTCGSRVCVDVMVTSDHRIDKLGVDVNACALGQASTAILAEEAIGKSLDELCDARDQFAKFLDALTDEPGSWKNLDLLKPAQEHKGRHAAILLPYDAAVQAMKNANAAERAA
ncbi:iron-sulfur cluster assembly scaffold protein [Parasphingorhabdus sp.]|uniref:iron-sulfur cluster assembly scaffold protein n=1 Tax=Parasphingorhabdus sp. TaxID=2709688 RepID=UPI003264DE89